MKKTLDAIIKFAKNSPGVIYSLALIVVIPTILYIGTYLSLSQFEVRFNEITLAKALLTETTIINFMADKEFSSEELQRRIDAIKNESTSISLIEIVQRKKEGPEDTYIVLASTDHDRTGQDSKDFKYPFVVQDASEGYANMVKKDGERQWEISRLIPSSDNAAVPTIVTMRLSLAEVDFAFQQSILRAYGIIAVASLIMILLVTNYLRLARYVILFNKIKEIDQMKDDFVSMASHELKTPLTAISGYVDILEPTVREKISEDERKYLKNIKISSERLRDLVNDMLEVSKLDQNRIPFSFTKISVNELVEHVADSLESQARAKSLQLLVECDDHAGMIMADSSRLEQVLVNLIGNAIKYTPKGEVKVRTHGKGKNVSIVIEDTGLGMTASQQKRLFEKFYRVRTDETLHIPGTGLGLWITKQLVEKMHGTIEAESMEGVGSRFILTFKTV